MLIVMKFGGTSVGSTERILQAARLVTESASQGNKVVVVTSAMGGVTDLLIDTARRAAAGDWDPKLVKQLFEKHKAVADELVDNNKNQHPELLHVLSKYLDRFEGLCSDLSLSHDLTPRLLDSISSMGEQLAAPLVSAAIVSQGNQSQAVDATELIVTTDKFGGAEPLMDETKERTCKRLNQIVNRGDIPVVTGFIGATTAGVLTTLGRGGSDYSASILASVLDAQEVWIWTDVNGVMTANPSEVPEARSLSEISYSEASELAYYGAKVLHYKTILPAFQKKIPVRILNSFNPEHPGTRVSVEGNPSEDGVKAVTSILGVSLITISGTGMQGIPGIVAKTFDVVAAEQANVLMISQASSENNVCFIVKDTEVLGVMKALRSVLDFELSSGHIEEISDKSVAIVAAVGDRMHGTPGIAATVFGALGKNQINVIAISQGSSERNISLVVNESDASRAVQSIHQAFHLEEPPASATSR